MKRENEIYPRNIADRICREFEELLESHDIYVPDDERTGDEREACLYGDTYYGLVDAVEWIVTESLERIKENPGMRIVGGLF